MFTMNYFPERLKAARKIKGWSFQKMADHLTVKISKQALHKYETGKMAPSGEVLLAISQALEVKPDYFLRQSTIRLPEVEFRKKSTLGVKEIDSIKERVKDVLERYIEVEQLLDLDVKFRNPIKDCVVSDIVDVEEAVLKLISHWNLGFDPIPNVIEMLEENGVRVIEIDAPEKFDGLSSFVGDIPIIVLNKHYSIERKRFTAIHELGHLLLNIKVESNKEKICHAFAGSMLLPGDVLINRLGQKRNNIALGELISIKEEFGVSIQAIMMRAQLQGIIDKSNAERFWRYISSNKKEENLGNFVGKEKSYRFEHLVFRLAAEEIVSMSKAANLAGLKLSEFREKLDAIY